MIYFQYVVTENSQQILAKVQPLLDNVRILKASLMQRPCFETFKYSILYLYSIYVCSPCWGRVAGDEPH